jgi:predicted enzyme related to lactoylglutathione lyase
MPAHGTFVWNELQTRNVEEAKRFYGATLGWTFDAMPMADGGTYWVGKLGEAMVGGLFSINAPMFDGIPEHWFAYIEVDDVDARVAKVAPAGGKIHREPWDVPNVGRIAIVADSNGAVIGWMTSASRPA